MEQPAVEGSQEVLWCNYNADGTTSISSSAHIPLQLDLSNSSIARQISQQMQVQYALNGQGQIVYQVPQPHAHLQQVVVATAGQPTSLAAGTITPIVPQQVIEIPMAHVLPEIVPSKPNKPRSGAANERVHCEMCEKTFSCAANLRDHMRLHTGQKPFKCTECDMEFAQRSNWRLHRRVHTGEKPYMCGICGKTFARSSHLPSHMRIHTGEKPFKCELCHNCFPSSQALKNHTRTHTGEKPFTCLYCETSFTHSSSLSSHKKKCNGVKRKRGRPIGTGRRPTKKKQPSGRPRGRPKKKLRTGRGRKRLNPPAFDDSECLVATNNCLIDTNNCLINVNSGSIDTGNGLIDTANGSIDTANGSIDTKNGSIDANIGSIDGNCSSFETNNAALLDKKLDVAAVKIESDVNRLSDIDRNTIAYEEPSDSDMIVSNKLCEKSSNSLPTVRDKAKLHICQAADEGESSSISKHPKVAIRESKRLRIKQANRRANMDALNFVKIEPEILISYERREDPNESIVVDFECTDETFNSQPVVIEHRMSNDCSEPTFSSHNPPCIEINIASGTSGNTASMIDHQKEVTAITMATLQQQQQQQQGVLNLTHHQADSRSVQVVDASKDQPQPVLTLVNPLDLQQQSPQHLSSHNMHIVTQTIPLAHSTQNLSTIHKMNIRETYHQTAEQPQHSNEVVKEGIKDAFLQKQLSGQAPPTQYVSYQLGDSHVHVPVTLSRSINNLESNW